MNITQKVVLVTAGSGGTQGITTINKDLREGWRVAQVAPMGGAGSGESARFAALVVLELSGEKAEGMMQATAEQAEADIEGQIEQALEGGYIVESEDIEGWRNPDLD
jgi:NAD(P)H-dependent FMN reductase